MNSRPDEGMPTATAPGEIPTVPPPAPPPEEHIPEIRGQGVHATALRIRASWSKIGSTPGCPACESPGPGKSHTRECKTYLRCLGREPQNSISGGGETRNCWRSGHTTAGPEFEFNRSQPEEIKNNLCDRQRESGGPDG